jgi:hypothetical protein
LTARLFYFGAAVVFGCMAWAATDWPPASATWLIVALAVGFCSIAAGAIVYSRARRDLPPEARVSRSTRRRGA